jgi:SNF2 family DNA or RNA helicase
MSSSTGAELLVCMGGGKTLMSISIANLLEAKKILVLCPVSVVGVWGKEFSIHSKGDFNVVPLRKLDRKTPLSVLEKSRIAQEALKSSKPTVIVTNYESAWRKPLADVFLNTDWDLIIADEIHKIQNPKSKVAKYLYRLRPSAKFRLGLTGTEFGGSGSPLNIFGQFKFLNETVFGSRFDVFAKRYSIADAWGNPKKFINEDDLKAKIDGISYRATDEVLKDLPEATHTYVDTPLSGEAARMYEQVENGMWAELEAAENEAVIARVVIAQLTRCAQLTGGHIGGVIDLDRPDMEPVTREVKGSSKAQALEDILSGLDPKRDKVVVFARFTYELQQIAKIAKKYNFRYGEISGNSKSGLNANSEFSDDCDLVGAQIQSGGVGITLVKAAVCVFYSKGFSSSDYLQAEKRTHRPGQTKHVSFYHFVTPGTIDERIENSLKDKENVLDWYKQEAKRRQAELFAKKNAAS